MSWRPRICCRRVPSQRVSMEEALNSVLCWLSTGPVWSGVATCSGQVLLAGWTGLASRNKVGIARGLGDGAGVLIRISGGGGKSDM